jgi:hypothetical protein
MGSHLKHGLRERERERERRERDVIKKMAQGYYNSMTTHSNNTS